MLETADHPLCEKFEANVFAKSRCQNCFRRDTAHQAEQTGSEPSYLLCRVETVILREALHLIFRNAPELIRCRPQYSAGRRRATDHMNLQSSTSLRLGVLTHEKRYPRATIGQHIRARSKYLASCGGHKVYKCR
uniref:Uncharacterized protein n=1 Tax=Varanus komodoensis TaxID=61221 RepID=A0A8D2J661_VARKO